MRGTTRHATEVSVWRGTRSVGLIRRTSALCGLASHGRPDPVTVSGVRHRRIPSLFRPEGTGRILSVSTVGTRPGEDGNAERLAEL